MVTENANFKINHVNNCAYSTTDGVQKLYNLSGKLWRNFIICYALE